MLKSNSLCEQIARTCGWTQVNGQIYKLLEKASADGDEPNALYANDWEEAYLLACGNSTAEDGSPTQREYSFDIKLLAAVRVKATSPDQARQLLHELFDSADCNGGAWPSGDPVLFEASLVEGQEPVLVTHDGHDAPALGEVLPVGEGRDLPPVGVEKGPVPGHPDFWRKVGDHGSAI